MKMEKLKLLKIKKNQKTTPSIVAFDKNGKKLVGELAKRQQSMNQNVRFHLLKEKWDKIIM